jgi:hypothetical protein
MATAASPIKPPKADAFWRDGPKANSLHSWSIICRILAVSLFDLQVLINLGTSAAAGEEHILFQFYGSQFSFLIKAVSETFHQRLIFNH